MAGMVHRLLNLTNARPAGVSAQSTTSTALVGDEIPLISMRNADFSAQANTLVDEFFQVHNDAAGVAAQAPFNALSGVCSSNVADTPGATLCYIDSTDASTDVRGNITGTSQTTAAYRTVSSIQSDDFPFPHCYVHKKNAKAVLHHITTSSILSISLISRQSWGQKSIH